MTQFTAFDNSGVVFRPDTFGVENNFLPSYAIDAPNVIERTYLKLSRGGAETRGANPLFRGLGNSLAEISADNSLGNVEIPYRLDRNIEDNFFDQLDPAGVDAYASAGLTADMFAGLDLDESERLYEQTIRLYALSEHIDRSDGWFDVAASNTLALGANIISDPITYATLGTGATVAVAGRALGKQTVTRVGTNLLRGSAASSIRALDNSIRLRRVVNGLIAGSANGTFNLAYQRAAYESQVNNGLLEDLGFDVSKGQMLFASTIGALLGGALSEGLRVRKTPKGQADHVHVNVIKALESADTPGAQAALYKLRTGGEIDIALIDAGTIDVIDATITEMYGASARMAKAPWFNLEGGLAEYLEQTAKRRTKNKALTVNEVLGFLQKAPTIAEFNTAMRSGVLPDQTRFTSVQTRRVELNNELNRLIRKRDTVTEASEKNLIDGQIDTARRQVQLNEAVATRLTNSFRRNGASRVVKQVDDILRNMEVNDIRSSSTARQEARLSDITDELIEAATVGAEHVATGFWEKVRRHVGAKTIGQFFTLQGLADKAAKSPSPRIQYMGMLLSALDNTTTHLKDWTGKGFTRNFEAARNRSHLIAVQGLKTTVHVIRDKTMPKELKKLIIDDGFILAGNPSELAGAKVHELSKQIAKEVNEAFNEWSSRGLVNGYLRNPNDGFVSTSRILTDQSDSPIVSRRLWERYQEHYLTSSEIQGQVAERLGFISRTTSGEMVLNKKYAAMDIDVLTRADLDEADAARYFRALTEEHGELHQVATNIISRKRGVESDLTRTGKWSDPIEDLRYSNDAQMRKIDQEVFFSREAFQSGEVNINPINYMLSYARGTGYNILRQDTLNSLTGQRGISWKAFTSWLRKDVEGKALPEEQDFMKILVRDFLKAEEIVSGRGIEKSGAPVLNIFRNLIASAIQGQTGLYAFGIEMATNLGINYAQQGGTRNFMRTFFGNKGLMKLAKDNIETLDSFGRGIEYLKRSTRYVDDPALADLQAERVASMGGNSFRQEFADAIHGRIRPRSGAEDGIAARVEAFTEGIGNMTHVLGLEAKANRMNRTLVNFMSVDALRLNAPKLNKLREALDGVVDLDEKALKGAARKAGFKNLGQVESLLKNGLAEENTITAINRMIELDKELFDDPTQFFARAQDLIARETDPDMKLAMREAFDKMRDYMDDDMNAFVPKAGVLQQSLTQRPEGILINQFLSFARAANARLFPRMLGGTAAGGALAFTMYAHQELIMSNLIQVLRGQLTPQEALEQFDEDNIEATIAKGFGRVPFAGPFSSMGMGALDDMIQGHKAKMRPLGLPAYQTFSDIVEGTADLARIPFDDRLEFTDKDREQLLRLVPGWNLWYRQIFGEVADTILEDE